MDTLQAVAPSRTEVLSAALDVGESMIRCGAEINRVEDTIERICNAYRIGKVEVFSITSLIVVTVRQEGSDAITQARRIYNYTTSLDRIERLNALSREICAQTPPVAVVTEKIEEIFSCRKRLRWSSCVGYVIAAASFAVFFGGDAMDALATVPISLFQFFSDSLVKRRGANRIVYTVLTSAVCGAMALAFTYFGFGRNADKIMIGNIMSLIPGLQLTNSLREMFCGDTMSGFIRLLEAVMISVAIALGFAIPMLITGGLGI